MSILRDDKKTHVYEDEIKYIPKRIIIKKDNLWAVDYIWTRPKVLNKKATRLEVDRSVLQKLMDVITMGEKLAPPVIYFNVDNGRIKIKHGHQKIRVAKSLNIRYIPILILNMKDGKPINPIEVAPKDRYWKYVAFGDYEMDTPENILSDEQVEEWESKPDLITIKQLMANDEWQDIMKQMHGNWKLHPGNNVRILRKYLDGGRDRLKVLRVHIYLTGIGFTNGTIQHWKIDELVSELETVINRK